MKDNQVIRAFSQLSQNTSPLARKERVQISQLFQKISVSDFTVMWTLAEETDGTDQKIYLQTLADKMNLPMPTVSKIARMLQDKGLVVWKHDGSGEEGTWLQMTEKGAELFQDQQVTLNRFRENVVERFGKRRMYNLLKEMTALEAIMNSEIEEGMLNESKSNELC